MPHLKIRGIEKSLIIKHSKEIIDGLTSIIQCDRTWITLEHQETEYIFDGQIVDGYTFIEFFWFDRGPETKKEVAKFLTDLFHRINNHHDFTVIFMPLTGDNYCDNGTFY